MPVLRDARWPASHPARGRYPAASGDWLNVPTAIGVFVMALGLLIWQARFRVVEASVSAWVIRLLRVRSASSLGPDVVFPLGGRWVGFSLTVACTAALLMVPFFVIAGVLLLFRRVPRRRILVALWVAGVVLFVVNQLRLVVIAVSMLWWGFQTGYQRSHVLIGTTLSTLGVIVGIIIFVWMLVDDSGRHRRPLSP